MSYYQQPQQQQYRPPYQQPSYQHQSQYQPSQQPYNNYNNNQYHRPAYNTPNTQSDTQYKGTNTINYHATTIPGYALDLYPLLMCTDTLPGSSGGTGVASAILQHKTKVLPTGLIQDHNVTIESTADTDAIVHLQKLSGSYNKKMKLLTTREEQIAQIEQINQSLNNDTDHNDTYDNIQSLSPDPASCVIHFRNVTDTVEQADLAIICAPYGKIAKTLMLRNKNQAMVQFERLNSAIACMNYYIQNNTTPNVRGVKVYMKFSQHQDITVNENKKTNIISVICKCDYDPELHGYTMTVDLLYNIFINYGAVDKIVLVKKFDWQAFIQFQTSSAAESAITLLNGRSVYIEVVPSKPLEIQVNISYSTLQDLNIRTQGFKSKDFQRQFQQQQMQQQQPPPPSQQPIEQTPQYENTQL